MKKFILLLTLTMMFGQTKLETRLYELPRFNFNGDTYEELDLFQITGYNFDFAHISIANATDYTTTHYSSTSIDLRMQIYNQNGDPLWISRDVTIFGNNGSLRHNNTSHLVYKGEPLALTQNSSSTGHIGYIDLVLAVTAEFPQEDTGYIEDGFDYCVEPGANLMSYPCDSDVALLDAIPTDALSQFSGIIGQGLASVQLPNGTWVGSLTNMQASSGYWITSTTSLCFNYDCSEN